MLGDIEIVAGLKIFDNIPLQYVNVDMANVLSIASQVNAYDAYLKNFLLVACQACLLYALENPPSPKGGFSICAILTISRWAGDDLGCTVSGDIHRHWPCSHAILFCGSVDVGALTGLFFCPIHWTGKFPITVFVPGNFDIRTKEKGRRSV